MVNIFWRYCKQLKRKEITLEDINLVKLKKLDKFEKKYLTLVNLACKNNLIKSLKSINFNILKNLKNGAEKYLFFCQLILIYKAWELKNIDIRVFDYFKNRPDLYYEICQLAINSKSLHNKNYIPGMAFEQIDTKYFAKLDNCQEKYYLLLYNALTKLFNFFKMQEFNFWSSKEYEKFIDFEFFYYNLTYIGKEQGLNYDGDSLYNIFVRDILIKFKINSNKNLPYFLKNDPWILNLIQTNLKT